MPPIRQLTCISRVGEVKESNSALLYVDFSLNSNRRGNTWILGRGRDCRSDCEDAVLYFPGSVYHQPAWGIDPAGLTVLLRAERG